MNRAPKRLAVLAACWLIIQATGCVTLPQSQTSRLSDEPFPEQWTTQISDPGMSVPQTSAHSLLALVEWPELNPFIQQALAKNPDIQQTALALSIAQLRAGQASAENYPQLNAGMESSRAQNKEFGNRIGNQHTLGLELSLALDVWGKIADETEAAQLEADAAAMDLDSAQRTLTAHMIKAAIEVLYTEQLIDIEQQRAQSYALNETISQQRFRRGLAEKADWDGTRSQVKTSLAALKSLEENREVALRGFGFLMGDFEPQSVTCLALPDTLDIQFIGSTLPDFQLPSALLGNRSDLKAAFQRLQAADANSRVAYKQLLPSFSLTARYDNATDSISELLHSDPVWALLGNITQPLFKGGQLRKEAQISQLSAERAYWEYRKVLLQALLEVENQLGKEASLAKQEVQLAEALGYANKTQSHYEARYREGLVSILDVLNVQRSTFELAENLLQVRFERLSNRIDLGLAMGLGLEKINRTESERQQ